MNTRVRHIALNRFRLVKKDNYYPDEYLWAFVESIDSFAGLHLTHRTRCYCVSTLIDVNEDGWFKTLSAISSDNVNNNVKTCYTILYRRLIDE